jgi:formylglycine-generating enzyme required for sulfatase activity
MLRAGERAAVARALAKEPNKRWPNCRAFVEALAVPGAPVPAPSPPSPFGTTVLPAPSPRPGPRGRGRWVLLAGLLLLLAVGLPLLLGLGRGRQPVQVGIPTEDLVLDLGGGVKLELVYIKEGDFWMGSPRGESTSSDDKPRHIVEITKPFWLGKSAVTQQQYTRLTGMGNPSYCAATGGGKDKVQGMDTSRFPVENVSWDDATAFCEELNRKHLSQAPEALRQAGYKFRLPTEAQWEYACRAGTGTAYYFGDDAAKLSDYAWYEDNSSGRTHEVGTRQRNGFGLYDMHGNVWQWCEDYYDPNYYSSSPIKDPFSGQKGAEALRVLRGGSWVCSAGGCRAASRGLVGPAVRYHNYGFRVAFRLD